MPPKLSLTQILKWKLLHNVVLTLPIYGFGRKNINYLSAISIIPIYGFGRKNINYLSAISIQVMNAVTVIVIIYTLINYMNNCNLHKWAYISE